MNNFFTSKLLRLWLLTGLFFIVAEAGMRYRAVQRFGSTKAAMVMTDPVEGTCLTPNFVSKGALRTITINEHGFRGASFPLEPVPGTVRIACLGSSTVFSGMTNSDGDTFPAVLEKNLNEDLKGHPPVEVVNTGIPGMGTESVLKHLQYHIAKVKPQIAVFYPPPNDLGTEIAGPGSERTQNMHFLRVWRKQNSVFYNAVLDKITQLSLSPKTAAARFLHFPKAGQEHLVAKYKQLIDACRQLNIEPVLAVHSFLLRKDQTAAQQQRNLRGDFWGLGVPGALEAIGAQNTATREVAEREKVPLLDTEFCVPATAEYFEDALHLTPKGNAILARTMADEIEKQKIIGQQEK